jgi:hypothetical protein
MSEQDNTPEVVVVTGAVAFARHGARRARRLRACGRHRRPGAHGDFDDRSMDRSYQWWANTRRGWLIAAGGGLAGAAYALWKK